jgi:hypothetical protein
MFDPGIERKYPYLMGYLSQVTQKRWVVPRLNWAGGLCIAGILVSGSAMVSSLWGNFGGHLPAIIAGIFAATVGGVMSLRTARSASARSVEDPRTAYAREVATLMVALNSMKRLHRDLDEGSLLMLEEASRGWTRIKAALESGAWIDPYRINTLAGLRDRMRNAADAGMADILTMYRPYLPMEAKPRGWDDYANELVETFVKSGKKSGPSVPAIFWDANAVADKLARLAAEAERISLHGDPQAVPIPGQAIDHVLGEIKVRAVAESELDSQQVKLN